MLDSEKFPEGMKGFGDWVHSQEVSPGSGVYFKYGLCEFASAICLFSV